MDTFPEAGLLEYEILNPNGTFLLDLISTNYPYSGELWQTGDHVIEVVNRGGQAIGFDIRFDIE